MNIIFTIKTNYSIEKYFLQNVSHIDAEFKLQTALDSIGFEEPYRIVDVEFVDKKYKKIREQVIAIYENIFRESVEEDFLQGEYTTLEAILNEIERGVKMNEREIEKAVELLIPLLQGMAEDRGSHVEVWAETYFGADKICVEINKAKYEINVTAMNMRAMIRSVVDTVALKF